MAKTRVVVIIQARMGSTRLPGKILIDFMGKTVLEHVVERVRACDSVDEVVIATTVNPADDVVERLCAECGVSCFRGSEEDVLERYYLAALKYKASVVVRVTSDCPLIDPIVLRDMIDVFVNGKYDLVTNAGDGPNERTFPRGMDSEIFSFSALEKAHIEASNSYQREHVTPYIYETTNNIFCFRNANNYSEYRLTLDTEEDCTLLEEIYRRLYKGDHNFYMAEIVELLSSHPELVQINRHIEQKTH